MWYVMYIHIFLFSHISLLGMGPDANSVISSKAHLDSSGRGPLSHYFISAWYVLILSYAATSHHTLWRKPDAVLGLRYRRYERVTKPLCYVLTVDKYVVLLIHIPILPLIQMIFQKQHEGNLALDTLKKHIFRVLQPANFNSPLIALLIWQTLLIMDSISPLNGSEINTQTI